MEDVPKKKKVGRAMSKKVDPEKKQVTTKKGNAAQKNTKGLKASKKENPTAKNRKPPTNETNEKIVTPAQNPIKSMKAGLKKMDTKTKQGRVLKGKPNRNVPSKIQTKAHALNVNVIPKSKVGKKHAIGVTPNKAQRETHELAAVIPSNNEEDEKACEFTIQIAPKNELDENEKSLQPREHTKKIERNDETKRESHESKSIQTPKTRNNSSKKRVTQSARLDRKYLTRKTNIFGKKSLTPNPDVLEEPHEALKQKNQIQRSHKSHLIWKSSKESGIEKHQVDSLLKNDETKNTFLMGISKDGITHVNKRVHEIIKTCQNFSPEKFISQDAIKMRDEEHPKEELDNKEKIEDDLNKTVNISSGKYIDSKLPYSEESLVDAFNLAMNDKIWLNLLRDQIDESSSDDSRTGMSSNPGVLIWEVQSSQKLDAKQCRTEERSKPHYENDTPVRDYAHDECSLEKEILDRLMTAFDNSPDIPERASQANEDVKVITGQDKTEEQTKSGVSGTENHSTLDNFPMTSDNLQEADDLVKILGVSENKSSENIVATDHFFVDAVNNVFKERENEFEEEKNEAKKEELDPTTSSQYQPLLKFPIINPSVVNNEHEDSNEKEYLVKLKSDIESSPSGGILAMSKYFIDILSLHKYLRYFNRNQFFQE